MSCEDHPTLLELRYQQRGRASDFVRWPDDHSMPAEYRLPRVATAIAHAEGLDDDPDPEMVDGSTAFDATGDRMDECTARLIPHPRQDTRIYVERPPGWPTFHDRIAARRAVLGYPI